MADVAALAGVSKTAVSAALHHGKGKTTRIGEDTAKLIHEAAEKLGYRTNLTAQSLATGRTGYIGFLLSSTVSQGFMNPYFTDFLQGAEARCRKSGYGMVVAYAPFSEVGDFIRSSILGQRRLDGLIVAGELHPDIYLELNAARLPFIVLNAFPQPGVPTIGSPSQPDIFNYIAGQGHRRAIFTVDRTGRGVSPFLFEMAKKHCPQVEMEFLIPDEGEHPNWEPGFGLGSFLFKHWVSTRPSKRATFIVSNGVLQEFYGELVAAGFKCPEDVSLMGDNSLRTCFFPRFTLLCGPHEDVGAEAAGLLIEAAEKGLPIETLTRKSRSYPNIFINGSTTRRVIS